jgi:hypothetical protein
MSDTTSAEGREGSLADEDARAIMGMLVTKKRFKAGDKMANAVIVANVFSLGIEGARQEEALTFAGDQAWIESCGDGFSLMTEAGYAAGAADA